MHADDPPHHVVNTMCRLQVSLVVENVGHGNVGMGYITLPELHTTPQVPSPA